MDDLLKDPYEGVVLNHTHFDWKDPSLDADAITATLMGYHDHWDEPEFAGLREWEIERKILFDAGRPHWGETSKYGKPYYRHFLSLIKLLFPETHITPSLADAVMFFCIGYGGGNKKILNLIGSLNSGKSAAAIRIAYACMVIDPEYCAVYVANPFDNAADSTVYGDVEELWDQLVTYHPNTTNKGNRDAPIMFPFGKKYAAKAIDFVPNIPKAGRIELRNIKHVGKFKGTKSRGNDVNRGIILVIIDEVNEIENLSFLTTLTNIASQDAFFCVTSENFKSPDDLGGQLCEPVNYYGGPSSYEELDIDADIHWASKASSHTLRFDGLNSPNILADRDIYPKLFRRKDLERIKNDYGEHSPDFASQVRSFPQQGDEANTVLSKAKISSSRHKDNHYTILRINGSVSFADPAFGGRDKAKWIFGDMCTCNVIDGEGNSKVEELLIFREHIHTLRLVKDAFYNDYWFDRMKLVKIDVRDFTIGGAVSYEDQIAIQCHELNTKFGIPSRNFGYDFSLKPDIVSSMNKVMGFEAVSFDYNQGPFGYMLQNIKQNSIDCCKDRITELAMLAADYFLTKQIRGGSFIETATVQLSRTQYETKNKKYAAEKKKDFKMRFGGVSPDDRDCLMGACGLAAMRGFRQNVISAGKTKSAWDEIQARGLGRSKVGRRL